MQDKPIRQAKVVTQAPEVARAAAPRFPFPEPQRVKLDDERDGSTHKFSILSAETKDFYLTHNHYTDGRLGEFFLIAGREGSFSAAALDLLATAISIGLQHGIPLETFLSKMRHVQCEPAGMVAETPLGMVENGQKFFAKSPFDYIAQYLSWKYPGGYLRRR